MQINGVVGDTSSVLNEFDSFRDGKASERKGKKLNHELEVLMAELKYEDDIGAGVQSVNDNEAGFDERRIQLSSAPLQYKINYGN